MTKSKTFTVALIVVLILLAASAWLMFGRTAAGMSYPDADKYTVGNTTVTRPVNNLYVDWTSGQVNIEYHDGTGVIVSETANRELSEDDRLRWWLDGDTLRIRFARPGFRISVNLDKHRHHLRRSVHSGPGRRRHPPGFHLRQHRRRHRHPEAVCRLHLRRREGPSGQRYQYRGSRFHLRQYLLHPGRQREEP